MIHADVSMMHVSMIHSLDARINDAHINDVCINDAHISDACINGRTNGQGDSIVGYTRKKCFRIQPKKRGDRKDL